MKLLFDFLPIILFFGAFKYAESHKDWAARFASDHFGALVSSGVVGVDIAPVLIATLVVIVASLAQVGYLLARRQKVDLMLWVSLGLVTVLGGATVWFQSETFIKWKPSVLYWAMAAAFLCSQMFWRKNLLQLLIGAQLQLPDPVWRRLNVVWIVFFAGLGLLNLWIAYHFSTAIWVDFKVFGMTGLMLVFTIAQGLYISRYLKDDDAPAQKPQS